MAQRRHYSTIRRFFGVRDSIRSVVSNKQYGEIELYDAKITTVPSTLDDASHEDFLQKHSAIVDSLLWINTQAVGIKAGSI